MIQTVRKPAISQQRWILLRLPTVVHKLGNLELSGIIEVK